MNMTKVLQIWIGILLCSVNGLLGSALECSDRDLTGARCSISVEKLLDRAIQHAELIYRISDEARTLFLSDLQEEMFIPLAIPAHQSYGGNSCMSNLVHIPTSKLEIQQISDKWLLHSILILVQFWIDPLADLQDSLDRYDNAPSSLLSKTRWMSTKLINLKHGVLVLMSKILDEGSLELENNESVTRHVVAPAMAEQVLRDYTVLTCFKKDAHKIETFLKLLRCRQTDNLSCSFF
ncbi:somatolactin beta isoform X1 [Hemibagrus wyckioides]|uniref:somatolactin beta isoform X1 n=1 Tax=Hemibagrus wyckioides TaxID=337641 RepID=UPI00266D83C0|nr:somatolactin beta isoform X1 [Hemibagrus wyckioides]